MTGRVLERLGLATTGSSASLFIALCINAFGAGMFYPFALLFFTDATSLSVGRVGFILTVATLITLATTPITGALVDRFGPRRLVVLSQVLEATGFAAYLLVASGITLFVASLVVTSAARMFFASFSTLIAQAVEGNERDRWYGLVGMTQALAASASGLAASLVISTVGMAGFRVVIIVNACCLLISGLLLRRTPVRRIPGAARPPGDGYRSVLRDRPFVKIVIANALFVLCSMLPGLGLAVFVTDGLGAPLWAVGMLGIVQTALIVGGQRAALRTVESRQRTRIMLGAGLLWIVACVLMALAVALPGWMIVPWLLGAIVVFTVAQMLYIPTARALAAGMGPDAVQGRYIATYEFSWGIAAALGPMLFGVTFEVSPAAPWIVVAGLVLVAVMILRSADQGMRHTRGVAGIRSVVD